jgi:hypothetical protein
MERRTARVSRRTRSFVNRRTRYINRIIYDIDTQRQRWLRAVDSPLPQTQVHNRIFTVNLSIVDT